ncbi:MAG: hypothetical protein H0U37_05630 [Chloroflexi bacterium]|nr:hypothetical protein [Chloroflexota bacterium]
MSDDIGAHLRIIHRAGCTAPSVIAALPFATAMGRNPAIDLVADGKGGELFRCRLCGMREGEAPAPETQAPDVVPAEPEAESADNLAPGGLSWSKIEAEYRALAGSTPTLNGKTGRPYRRSHPDRPSRPEVAAALMSSTATLKRACDRHKKGTTWPPLGL